MLRQAASGKRDAGCRMPDAGAESREPRALTRLNPPIPRVQQVVDAVRNQPERDGRKGPASPLADHAERLPDSTRLAGIVLLRRPKHRPAECHENHAARRDAEATDPDDPMARIAAHLADVQLLAQL